MTKFKVGDWWRTRGGWYEQIVSLLDKGHPEYPMTTLSGTEYTKDGKYLSDFGDHDADLVQKMKPPVWEGENE